MFLFNTHSNIYLCISYQFFSEVEGKEPRFLVVCTSIISYGIVDLVLLFYLSVVQNRVLVMQGKIDKVIRKSIL